MANELTGNPLIVDTAVDATDPAGYPALNIVSIVWDAPTAVGDDLLISDQSGKVLIETKAYAAGAGVRGEVPAGYPILNKRINVETIDGGTLYIYLK